jgi:glycosyltransferase involved in cell wall biosynthesis
MPASPPPPAVSVVVGVYNRPDLVGAAIGSVLSQTRRDFELVVYDDGSTDDTAAAAERAAGGDPRVRVVRGEHRGFTAAVNRAAALCTGRYLGWVDSDDALAPTALEETAAVLEAEPDVGMVYTDYLTMNPAGQVVGPGSRTKIPYSRDRLLIDFMTFHFRLMRRRLFDAVGGVDETLDYAQDYDLCLKLSEVTEIRHLARPLYFYRVHRASMSLGNRLKQIEASGEAIRRALKRRGLDRQYELDVELVGRFRLNRR